MEKAKKFFEEIMKTEEAKALLALFEKPETEQEQIEAYLDIAEKLGVELGVRDIFAYISSIEADVSASGEPEGEELTQLAGGGSCRETYMQAEDCWWNDSCDHIINSYDNDLRYDETTDMVRATMKECGMIMVQSVYTPKSQDDT